MVSDCTQKQGEEKTPEQKQAEVLQRVFTVQLLQSENLCTALAAKHEALTEKTALAAFSAASGVEKMKKERAAAGHGCCTGSARKPLPGPNFLSIACSVEVCAIL